ncbi:MAG TPA: ImmA/IrrE family metallo-endopeptidase [Candidatus Dormibacteraeota bacterium]|nr:ImmA/IrrE family metallo-endopeptidase [Candidatus Dormibacteraeota bacterium]
MVDVHIAYCRQVARSVARRHRVTKPPIDVHAIAVKEGLQVTEADLGSVDARLYRKDSVWVLELNRAFAHTAQRFSVAHELGHLSFGHEGCGLAPADERAANVFAAELLMPLAQVKSALRRQTRLGELARTFDVSKEALQIKLNEHGLLLKLTSFD